MKILIAGGGIGGLTAALCLQQAGHDVRVFEQAAAFDEVGAGIQCGANALHVLASLNLMPALEQYAVEPEAVHFRVFDTGQLLYQIPLGDAYSRQYGARYYHLHRADLQKVLVDALNQRAAGALHLGVAVTGFNERADSVELTLADGRCFEGELLIGCDGIRSGIRRQILGSYEPRWTGNVAWRGVVDASSLPEGFMARVTSNFVGPKKHMVIYYLRKQALVNFVGVVENRHSLEDSWVRRAPWEELKADFDGWHETVQTVIDYCDRDACYRWALYDHQPIANWSLARVTLLGDAAHATLPFMASGAAMAIEDARILQRAIDQTPSVEEAVQMYQRNRYQRTRQIQLTSNKAGKLYHLSGKWARRLAFAAVGLRGNAAAFLPDYNANTIELH